MPVCYNCGEEVEYSENINLSTGRKFKINPNGTEHNCQNYGIYKNKYRNSVRVMDSKGRIFNALPCIFKCGEYVYRDELLDREPKLREMDSEEIHNYKRCYDLHLEKNIPIEYDKMNERSAEIFRRLSYSNPWLQFIDGFSKEEVDDIKRGMPADSRLRKYFDPEKKDPLVGEKQRKDSEELQKLFRPIPQTETEPKTTTTVAADKEEEKEKDDKTNQTKLGV